MEASGVQTSGYVVPTYRAAPGTVWYHFLHGNVPGHQIDFMYRPEVPQGSLTQQGFSHLARLVKYIEPRPRSSHAFAIGNLSRDDTQYEPGRGGVALIFGLRIQGAKDHAGRRDPPFCHAIAATDRHFDEAALFEAALAFHRKVQPGDESTAADTEWYRTYARPGQDPDALRPILQAYVADFDDLPAPAASALGLRWTSEGSPTPNRIIVLHSDEEPFESIAVCAARIAGVLVESDIRWTAISTGRESDVAGGVAIRFVPEHDAGPEAEGVPVFRMEDVPQDPREIAERLFGATEVQTSQVAEPRMGWRQEYGDQSTDADSQQPSERAPPSVGHRVGASFPSARDGEIIVEIADDGTEQPPARESGVGAGADTAKGLAGARVLADEGDIKPDRGSGKKARNQFPLLIGIGVVLAVGGAIAAVAVGTKDSGGAPAPSAAPEGTSSVEASRGNEAPPSGAAHQAMSANPVATVEAPSKADAVVAPVEAPGVKASRGAGKKRDTPAPVKKKSSIFVVP